MTTEAYQMRYHLVLTNEELINRFKQACSARKLNPGAFLTIFLDDHLPQLTVVQEVVQPQPQESYGLLRRDLRMPGFRGNGS